MNWSSKLFLLSADDAMHALANAAFMRMLRREPLARIPDFAGQRVRQASIAVQVVNGVPARIVRCTYSVLHIDGNGALDVERWNTQQFARVSDPFAPEPTDPRSRTQIVDATSRFIARGGSWEPDRTLLLRIEAAALGQLACPRVRVVR